MARNKYPEQTVEKILSISYRLFMEKGYENTTIQDITDELKMSKGAVYHHFKSKEDILNAIGDWKFVERSSFAKVEQAKSLTGLEKLKMAFCLELGDPEKQQLDKLTMHLLDNPRLLATMLKDTIKNGAPIIKALIDEGIADGSITVKDSRSASEVIMLLSNVWINPMCVPAKVEETENKVLFFKELMENVGIPLIDDQVFNVVMNYFKVMFFNNF